MRSNLGAVVDGRYRIERELGHGGMAIVYVATHVRLGTKCALKVISPDLARDREFQHRFEREALAAANVDNEHVVPVFDFGEHKHGLYIVMRYVDGPNLREYLRSRGPLAPERAVQVIEHVAAALDAAHARGLIHRDVKPANILIEDSTGHIFLADFGLTRPVATEDNDAKSALWGTDLYMAPERRRGDDTKLGDVYSLGCVLWDMLAGLEAQLPGYAAEELDSAVPQALRRVVECAIREHPRARFESAGALALTAQAAIEAPLVPPRVVLEALTEGLSARALTLCQKALDSVDPGDPAEREIKGIAARLGAPLSLVVAGGAGVGKSTLVNALLGRRIARTDDEKTRAIASFHFAEAEHVEIVTKGRRSRTQSQASMQVRGGASEAAAIAGAALARDTDFRIVGREQQSPDSDEIAGRRPLRGGFRLLGTRGVVAV